MKVEKLWENIFNYSDYVKGAEFSASDIIGDNLAVKLRKDNPEHREGDYKDKIAAFTGSAIHQRIESYIQMENAFGETNVESEVKLKFKNISGTADLIIDNHIILDFKTSGKKSNIQAKERELKTDNSTWRNQLYPEYGYIAWLVTGTHEHGILKVDLLPMDEVVKLIKDFLIAIEQPLEEMEQCPLCIQFKSRYCGVRKVCPKWNEDKEWSNKVEEW